MTLTQPGGPEELPSAPPELEGPAGDREPRRPRDPLPGLRVRRAPGEGGHANQALWHIVLTRVAQREPGTVASMQRRLAEGLTKRDIFHCLKRYVAREIFTALPR